MAHSFRSRLRSGETLFAPLLTLNSPAVAELMAEAGFDWLFIDAEHSTLDTSQMQSLLQAASPTPCVIRLASGDDVPIKKAEVEIAFDRPTRDWSSRLSKPTLNLFLFDVRERAGRHRGRWARRRRARGRAGAGHP